MARKTRPRSDAQHALVAGEILHRWALHSGRPVELPVPIELIIEQVYGLTIDWAELPEPPGTSVYGALRPSDRTIVMNSRYEDRFARVTGPERFTYAHELAHWVYDAGDPAQGTFDFEEHPEVFCRVGDTSKVDDTTRLREVNANKLAAHLLLPDHLVRAADLDAVLTDLRGTAKLWGVSRDTLRIKLEGLGSLDDADLALLFEVE